MRVSPFKTLTACALLLVVSGCKPATTGGDRVAVAALDTRCEAEFNRLVQIRGDARAYTRQDVINLIVELDSSQKAKSRCGRLLVTRLKAIAGVK